MLHYVYIRESKVATVLYSGESNRTAVLSSRKSKLPALLHGGKSNRAVV
jgi:hypothetical protein